MRLASRVDTLQVLVPAMILPLETAAAAPRVVSLIVELSVCHKLTLIQSLPMARLTRLKLERRVETNKFCYSCDASYMDHDILII